MTARFSLLILAPALTLLAAALVVGGCSSPLSPYSGLEAREIKALSAEETAGYLSGAGMSLALAAELNGYPGPKHVLELADDLQLSDSQRRETERMFNRMLGEATALGREIVEGERELDALFSERRADEKRLGELVRDIARLKGELRIAHLKWHLQTLSVLTEAQTEQYDSLRGYHSAHAHHH